MTITDDLYAEGLVAWQVGFIRAYSTITSLHKYHRDLSAIRVFMAILKNPAFPVVLGGSN